MSHMTRIALLCLGLGLALPARAAGLPPEAASPDAAQHPGLPMAQSDLVARLLPEVVNITVVQLVPPPNAPKDTKLAAYSRKVLSGSGFIIDPSGIIVTNRHVIENAYQITAIFSDRTRRRATLVYTAPIDMALLKVEAPTRLAPVKFGNSALMRPGDPVIAIGNPLGIGTTVTSGIVSALDRDIQETPVDAFIQTDAAINHGNSGGPLFNLKGEVIGINTALYSPDSGSVGIGFAIPSNDAQFVLQEVAKYGRVRAGYLGAGVQLVSSGIADAVGLHDPRGVMIDTVLPNTPAASAGLRTGDIILRIGETAVNEPRGYQRAVGVTPFDTMQTITFWRDHAEHTVSTKFIESPDSQPPRMAMEHVKTMMKELTPEDNGLALSQITPDLRRKYGLPATATGLVITQVDHNSIAEEDGLVVGDVVVQVGNATIHTAADLRPPMMDAVAAHQHHLLMMLRHGDAVRWVALPLWQEMTIEASAVP
jgi:serine protease Do